MTTLLRYKLQPSSSSTTDMNVYAQRICFQKRSIRNSGNFIGIIFLFCYSAFPIDTFTHVNWLLCGQTKFPLCVQPCPSRLPAFVAAQHAAKLNIIIIVIDSQFVCFQVKPSADTILNERKRWKSNQMRLKK